MVLSELTIQNSDRWPAIAVTGGKLHVQSCHLESNAALALLVEAGVVSINRSAFVANGADAVDGGAVHVKGGQLHIHQSQFENNVAHHGGALFLTANGHHWIQRSTFTRNHAWGDGGALFAADGSITLANQTELKANTASGAGNNIFAASTTSFAYALPAPPGHWIANPTRCNAASEEGPPSCNQRSGLTIWSFSTGQHFLDDDLPYTCSPGLIGSTTDETQQSRPECGGACPSGKYCESGTQEPLNCTRGHWCPRGAASPIPCPAGKYNPEEGMGSLVACLPCPPGRFCPAGAAKTTKCSPGSYAAEESTAECTPCGPGTYQSTSGALRCDVCGAGNFSTNIVTCTPCAVGEYCEQGVSVGATCPEGMTTLAQGGATVDDCVCKTGRFMNYVNTTYANATLTSIHQLNRTQAGVTCDECLPSSGYDCRSSGSTLESLPVKPGYWRSWHFSTQLRRCFHTEYCLGTAAETVSDETARTRIEGSTSTRRQLVELRSFFLLEAHGACAKGHTGPFCELCAKKYVMTSSGCEECNGDVVLSFVWPIVVLLSFALAIIYLCRTGQRTRVVIAFETGKDVTGSGFNDLEDVIAKAEESDDNGDNDPLDSLPRSVTLNGESIAPNEDKTDNPHPIGTDITARAERTILASIHCTEAPNSAIQEDMGAGVVRSIQGTDRLSDTQTVNEAPGSSPPPSPPSLTEEQPSPPQRWFHSLPHFRRAAANCGCTPKRIDRLQVKIRIIVSLIQVIGQLGVVFAIPYPAFYSNLISSLSVITLDFLEIIPFDCTVHLNHDHFLLVRTLTPLFVLLLSALYWKRLLTSAHHMRQRIDAIEVYRNQVRSTPDAAFVERAQAKERWANQILTINFVMFYLLFPSNSANIFATLQCVTLDDPGQSSFLRKDFSVDCNTPFHGFMTAYAYLMIIIYPLGIPTVYAYILFRKYGDELRLLRSIEVERKALHAEARAASDLASVRNKVAEDTESVLANACRVAAQAVRRRPSPSKDVQARIDILEQEENELRKQLPDFVQKLILGYELRTFYFELIECGRKLAIVCLPVFFQPPGSISQNIFGQIVCFVMFGLYMFLNPYAEQSDDRLAQICQCEIFFSLLSSIALQYDEAVIHDATNFDVLLSVLALVPFVFAIHQLWQDSMETLTDSTVRSKDAGSGSMAMSFACASSKVGATPQSPAEDNSVAGLVRNDHTTPSHLQPQSQDSREGAPLTQPNCGAVWMVGNTQFGWC